MSLATWDTITGALGSTTTAFGGNWGNLVSDFLNGVNVGLADPSKLPRINTLTRFKFEKLGLFDADESHEVEFSVDDIDTGPTRKVKIRRMNNPFETDYMLLEGLPQTMLNKTIDSDLNTITNIVNADVKAAAGIVYSKLALSSSILNSDINASAAIAYSKLALTGSILNADVNASAAIAYSKLALTGAVLNADINASAGIVTTKLADSTNFVLTNRTNTFGAFAQTIPYDMLRIMNSGGTFYSQLRSAATANRTPSFPDDSGTLATNSSTTSWTNKTMDADGTGNSITNIENADIKAAAGIVYSKLTLTGGILNADINASAAIAKTKLASLDVVNADVNASAAIATTKLADSGNFILKTVDNAFGAHFQDFTKMTAPASPGANDIRLYVDTSDTHLKLKTNAGTVVDLHAAGGSGITASSTDTFTNKTFDADGTGNSITNIENADIKAAAGIVTTKLADSTNFVLTNRTNTFGAFDQIFPTSRLLVGDSDASNNYIIAGSNLVANRTVTLPLLTGNDIFVTEAFTQPLTNKTIDALTNTVKNIGGASYEMWIESGPTYKARNISTGAITSNTNAKTLLKDTLDAMSVGAGTVGGKLLLRKGTYDIDGMVQVSNATYATNNVLIEGESKGAVIIRSITNVAHQFDTYCNTTFRNIYFDGNALSTQLIACGQPVYMNVSECIFARHTDIGLWFGVNLKGFVVDRCKFEDPRGTQDQFAFTCTEYGMVTNCSFDRLNTVFTSAVRGGSCLTSGGGDNIVIQGNRFTKAATFEQSGFGCSIEPWDRSYNNVTIANNVFQAAILRVGGGVITDWDNAGTPTCLMRNIIINGNVVNGAEIGVMGPTTSFTDKVREVIITNNIVYKSNNAGIRLNFISGPVTANGNIIVDSNMAGAVNTLGDHGCVWIYETTDVTFNGNRIYMTATGTNVNPYGLQISVVAGFMATGNSFNNTTGNPSYQDLGSSTNKYFKDNYGVVDDISHVRQRDLGSSLFRMHGNDGNIITFVNAEGTGPNQDFHFFPDYNKQSGATGVTFYYGYNSDFSSVRFHSKWSLAEKEYVNFDYGANLIDLKTPVRIGDSLRLKLNETGLTAEREFTFPDSSGKVLTEGSPVAQSPIIKRWGMVQAGSGNTAASVGQADGMGTYLTGTGAGSNIVAFDTTEGKVINYVTSAASGVAGGLLSGGTGTSIGRRLFGGRMQCRVKVDSTTTARFYFGLTSATTLPISETVLANTDSGIIVGFNAGDTNYQIRTNDGATSVTTTQMTGPVAKTSSTSFHTIEISWTAAGNYTVTFDGTAQTISTDLPATTVDLFPNLCVQTSAATARTLTLKSLYIEADK